MRMLPVGTVNLPGACAQGLQSCRGLKPNLKGLWRPLAASGNRERGKGERASEANFGAWALRVRPSPELLGILQQKSVGIAPMCSKRKSHAQRQRSIICRLSNT